VQDAMALQIINEYMVEQREELDLARTILDFLDIAGEDKAALLLVDEKIGDLVE
jgi:ferritin